MEDSRIILENFKKNLPILLVLVLFQIALCIAFYLDTHKKISSIIENSIYLDKFTNYIIAEINTEIEDIVSIEKLKEEIPLFLRRTRDVDEQIKLTLEILDKSAEIYTENTYIDKISLLVLRILPRHVLTNIISNIFIKTAIVSIDKIPTNLTQKLTKAKILEKNHSITEPLEVLLYPFDISNVKRVISKLDLAANTPIIEEGLALLVYFSFTPNAEYDPSTQEKYENREIKSKNIKKIKIQKGSILAYPGEPVTEEKFLYLAEYIKNLLNIEVYKTIFLFLITFLLSLFTVALISTFRKTKNLKILYTILLPMLLTPLIAQFLVKDIYKELTVFISLLPVYGIIGSLANGRKVTLIISVYYMLIFQIFILSSYLTLVYILSIASIIVIMSTTLKKRADFITIGLIVFFINFVFGLLILAFESGSFDTVQLMIFSFLSSFLNAMLGIGILPIFEYTYRLLTPFILYELISLEHPLMKELFEKAPGSYNHSQNVSILAEACAEAIDANSLLAKAGGMYHDIGKILNPEYFTENIEGNTRKEINPFLYVEIIKSHVTYGKELADKHRLPYELINIIQEHHGKSVIKYFYRLALKSDPNIDINLFRYQGPQPRSKESAIVSICDQIEAKTRSERELTQESIESIVEDTIATKMLSGDLEESNLTLSEIKKIKETLIRTIKSIYHSRIQYPK